MNPNARSARSILLFWSPLAAQWLMMGLEGPFLAAIIARLHDPVFNLAAYGVAYAFAILVESPVIMLMSASTALVEDADSYRKLRNFANALNVLATALLLLVLIPPVFALVMGSLLRLPGPVSELVYGALWMLLPWPAAIGYRRFLHGILIRSGRTRLVAYGTVLRLAGMGCTAVALTGSGLPGAWVGSIALSAGVVLEAAAAWWMAVEPIRELRAGGLPAAARPIKVEPESGREAGLGSESVVAAEHGGGGRSRSAVQLTYAEIAGFYYPLALTSLIGLAVQPMLTFFMGRAPAPVESLAVFPVVNSLSFLFRTLGLSFQEAAIALLGRRCEHAPELRRFAHGLALASTGALAAVAFSPLAGIWFGTVSGLPPGLSGMAVRPTQVQVLMPALSVLLSWQRAVLVQARATRPITLATAVEVAAIAALFPVFGWGMSMSGVTAASAALLGGRAAGVLFQLPRTARALTGARS